MIDSTLSKILENLGTMKMILSDSNSYVTAEIANTLTNYYELIATTTKTTPSALIPSLMNMLSLFIEESREAYVQVQNLMEKKSAEEILEGNLGSLENWQSSYRNAYITHAQIESGSLVRITGKSPENVLIVGSGALPITAFGILHHFPSCKISSLNNDKESTTLAKKLLGISDLNGTITVLPSSELEYLDGIESYDVIYLLASVGNTNEAKHKLLSTLLPKISKNTHILVRHALDNTLGTLLYSPFTVQRDSDTFAIAYEYGYSQNNVITHTILFK
ncbi:hypothetical protein IT418_03740 [bacterium]|nr:hypothetical protein [bacterium]